MSKLIPAHRPSLALQRQVRRELTNITVDTGLSEARIQAAAEIDSARIAALVTVGRRAQEQLVLMVNHERMLAEAVPEAEPGLLYLRDITQLSMASVLMEAGSRKGRP